MVCSCNIIEGRPMCNDSCENCSFVQAGTCIDIFQNCDNYKNENECKLAKIKNLKIPGDLIKPDESPVDYKNRLKKKCNWTENKCVINYQ